MNVIVAYKAVPDIQAHTVCCCHAHDTPEQFFELHLTFEKFIDNQWMRIGFTIMP